MSNPKKKRRSRLKTAIIVAVLLHLAAAVWAFTTIPDLRNHWRDLSVDKPAAVSEDESRKLAEPATPSPPPAPEKPSGPKKQPEEWNKRVESKVNDLVEAATGRGAEANQSLLEEKARELNRISSPSAIDDMTSTLQDALKLPSRKTLPNDNPQGGKATGKFNAKTAQIHKVRKEVSENGKPKYISIMVDANGRTMEVELDEADGKSVYDTMKLVEENPLLEKIYRQLVMPALDRASQAQDARDTKMPAGSPSPAAE